MPRIRLSLPDAPWTKVPNDLLDRLLPTLSDTELRILLVALRMTAGWNRPGQAITLTYRVLTARTGRRNEAVARALASLIHRGLVHAEGDSPRRFPARSVPETGGPQTKDREG